MDVLRSLKIYYIIFANSVPPDEMLPYAAFHLGLHCLLMECENYKAISIFQVNLRL